MEIVSAETLSGHIKIDYANGSSEEIDAGIYERKDENGDTVEQRAATQADIDRLNGLVASHEAALGPLTAEVAQVSLVGEAIEITYVDGTKESVSGGVYERKNADNETILERAATEEDANRLASLAGTASPGSPNDDGTADQGSGDAPGTPSGDDDGTADQGSGDAPGTAGNDTLTGTRGDDSVSGGDGEDSISGGRGNDDLQGGEGADTIAAGKGEDSITGDGGDDQIKAGAGDDTVSGGDGDDRLDGGSGHDLMDGGAGDDRIRGRSGDDTINGGDGNDRLRGDGGNDVITGGAGKDRVLGKAGDDTLDGGEGRDIYNGGLGADVLVFSADASFDVIKDFEDGIDLIDVSAYGFASAEDFLASAFERKGSTYIDLGEDDRLKIDDVALANITADDFIL
ncbi:calcium-binding protein [Marimonas lutisalis]|uniref:calcium-binding protein n=1 Tax=Marimonas lutisalis TaxID=2545756 RepID=UPI0010F868CF|nr:calcium-binding protein [Marimonas lutisalis]